MYKCGYEGRDGDSANRRKKVEGEIKDPSEQNSFLVALADKEKKMVNVQAPISLICKRITNNIQGWQPD